MKIYLSAVIFSCTILIACKKSPDSKPDELITSASNENILFVNDTIYVNIGYPTDDLWSIDETGSSRHLRTPKNLGTDEILDPKWGPDNRIYFIDRPIAGIP